MIPNSTNSITDTTKGQISDYFLNIKYWHTCEIIAIIDIASLTAA
jgi:hypothetical protein